ncbi:unnamed protein product [Rhizoctonia solani]|uniref:Uncharacterized protein n=1 Tax=Rhizoctonia solani TaxID=456999 RepID=A0A8H3BM76_9AGAM|nr:unnamed protein product [Rhizoctonia solani]
MPLLVLNPSLVASPDAASIRKSPRMVLGRDCIGNIMASLDETMVFTIPRLQKPSGPIITLVSKPKAIAYLAELLQMISMRAVALHLRLKQRKRLNSLNLFRSRFVLVLMRRWWLSGTFRVRRRSIASGWADRS